MAYRWFAPSMPNAQQLNERNANHEKMYDWFIEERLQPIRNLRNNPQTRLCLVKRRIMLRDEDMRAVIASRRPNMIPRNPNIVWGIVDRTREVRGLLRNPPGPMPPRYHSMMLKSMRPYGPRPRRRGEIAQPLHHLDELDFRNVSRVFSHICTNRLGY